MTEKLGIVVRPIGSADEDEHLDDLVAEEEWEGGGAREEMLSQEVPKLRPLGQGKRRPRVRHQVLEPWQRVVTHTRMHAGTRTHDCILIDNKW